MPYNPKYNDSFVHSIVNKSIDYNKFNAIDDVSV